MDRPTLNMLAAKVSNWGRWGTADQRGTLNHIGPEALLRAVASVKQGRLFHLALPFDRDGPQKGGSRGNPQLVVTELSQPLDSSDPHGICMCDDAISMPLQTATQWDALAHIHYDGKLFNGHEATQVLSADGAALLGIEHLASPGIVSRGILLDMARLAEVDVLPPEHTIMPKDLDAACERQGVTMAAGDILLVRTGHIRRFTVDRDRDAFHGAQPGLAAECAQWISDHQLAAVAADNVAVEVAARRPPGHVVAPLHWLLIRDMGCPMGEMFDLEALADDCAADGQYSFLFTGAPLPFTGAFGSPVNPLALK